MQYKYYRQYHDETKKEEITREQVVRSLETCYKNIDQLLNEVDYNQPIRTPSCYIWKIKEFE